jgi:hypothetical protein
MNLGDLKSDVNFLCGSTSATYLNSDKVRNMNVAYQDVARLIWESDGTWSYDDSNNTDTPRAFRTIANASASYLIPTTALRIKDVEVKNASGDWFVMKPITLDEMQISPDEWLTGTGMPLYYQLEGNEIRLFPAPGTGYTTMASGMSVRLSRAVTELGVSATSTVPGFATPFHRILSYAAAIDFTQDNQQRQFLAIQKDRLEKGLTRFYSKRTEDAPARIRPLKRRRQYE